MFRATFIPKSSEQRLLLEGEIAGPAVAELESAWRNRGGGRARRNRVVDLTGGTYLDASGETLFLEMWAEGAQFGGGGLSIREQIRSLGIRVRSELGQNSVKSKAKTFRQKREPEQGGLTSLR